MKQSTKIVIAIFVAVVIVAGFIPHKSGEMKETPEPKKLLEEELLKRGIVFEDYYTTTSAELEKALGVDIPAKGNERVGFLMFRSPLAEEAAVYEQAAEAVASVFPGVEVVAMLRLETKNPTLVYAPVNVQSYAGMKKIQLDVSRLLDRDRRGELLRRALAERGINVDKVYIFSPEEAASLSINLSSAGEVALIAIRAPKEEFPGRLAESFATAFGRDGYIELVVVGNLLAKDVKAVTFYYITREDYERIIAAGKPLKLEELPSIEIPVE